MAAPGETPHLMFVLSKKRSNDGDLYPLTIYSTLEAAYAFYRATATERPGGPAADPAKVARFESHLARVTPRAGFYFHDDAGVQYTLYPTPVEGNMSGGRRKRRKTYRRKH